MKYEHKSLCSVVLQNVLQRSAICCGNTFIAVYELESILLAVVIN